MKKTFVASSVVERLLSGELRGFRASTGLVLSSEFVDYHQIVRFSDLPNYHFEWLNSSNSIIWLLKKDKFCSRALFFREGGLLILNSKKQVSIKEYSLSPLEKWLMTEHSILPDSSSNLVTRELNEWVEDSIHPADAHAIFGKENEVESGGSIIPFPYNGATLVEKGNTTLLYYKERDLEQAKILINERLMNDKR